MMQQNLDPQRFGQVLLFIQPLLQHSLVNSTSPLDTALDGEELELFQNVLFSMQVKLMKNSKYERLLPRQLA